MAGSDKASLRIKLKYADVQTFVEKFAANVSRGGIFLASRTPKPVGTVVRFELLLADGTKLMKGEGEVAWVREYDPDHPNRPHGMGVKYRKIDADSRKLLDQIVAFKKSRGQRDDGGVPEPVAVTGEGSGGIRLPTPTPTPTPQPVVPVAPDAAATEPAAPPELDDAPSAEGTPAPAAAPAPAATATPSPGARRVIAVGSSPGTPAPPPNVDDLEALLAQDGPALEAVLERARTIARAAVQAGELGDLDALLAPAAPPQVTMDEARAGLAAVLGGRARAAEEPPRPVARGTRPPPPAPMPPPPVPNRLPATPPPPPPAALEATRSSAAAPAPAAEPPPAAARPAAPATAAVAPDEDLLAIGEITREMDLAIDGPTDVGRDEDDARAAGALADGETTDAGAADVAAREDEDAGTDATAPLDLGRIAAAAADLGAEELDPGDLARLAPLAESRGSEVTPLPPPPPSPEPARNFADEDGLDDSTQITVEDEDLEPVIEADVAPDVDAALDEALDIRIEGLPEELPPIPQPEPERAPPPEEGGQKKKGGFFKKLFGK